MSVKIRLSRTGAKKRPSYRIVVCHEQEKRDGKFVEILGYYNPLTEPATISIKRDRFDFWVNKGAQSSDTIKRLILGIKKMKPKKGSKKAELEEKPVKTEEVKTGAIPKEVTPEETKPNEAEIKTEAEKQPKKEVMPETAVENNQEQ